MIAQLKHLLPARLQPPLRAAYHWLQDFGSPYCCPVCGRKVVAFLPLPRHYFEQFDRHGFDYQNRKAETCCIQAYSCPHCEASDRDRLYALFLREQLPPGGALPGFSLLDFAPAPALSEHIRRHYPVRYRTADLYMTDVDDRVDITRMDIYPGQYFDAFICSHVLEHVADDHRALCELYRILKPGGWGIVMVPIDLTLRVIDEDPTITSEAERWRRFGQGDHVRIYSKDGFIHRLQAAGFDVLQYGATHFGTETFVRHGIAGGSVLYVVKKPSN